MVEGRAVANAQVFRACLPPPPALSLGERERGSTRFRQSRARRLVAARDALFPLPKGEGKGEGERDAANRSGRKNFTSSTRPAPRVKVGCHIERKACRWSKGARSQAHQCFERAFPLTPALSPGAREDTSPVSEKFRWRRHSLSCG